MSKYSQKLVYRYIIGDDIKEYELATLENNYEFMKSAIIMSKDKYMYNLCSDELKENYEFIKFLIDFFKDDLEFICNISNDYLNKTKDIQKKIELSIIMKKLTQNSDNLSIKIKYNFSTFLFVEIIKQEINKYQIQNSFSIIQDIYSESKIITDFFAEETIKNLFFYGCINLESEIHKKYKTYEEMEKNGKNAYILNIISCYDLDLAAYLQSNIKILDVLNETLEKIKNNWNNYIKTKEDNMYYSIIEEVLDYMEDYIYDCYYSAEDMLYLVAEEFNILDEIKKYYKLNQNYVASPNLDEYYNYENYDSYIDKFNDEVFDCDLFEEQLNIEKFSFKELKHYHNIKKIFKRILFENGEVNTIENINEPNGKIIKFKKKIKNKNKI